MDTHDNHGSEQQTDDVCPSATQGDAGLTAAQLEQALTYSKWDVLVREYTKLRWWRVSYTPSNGKQRHIHVVACSLWDIRADPAQYLPDYDPRRTYMRIGESRNPYTKHIPTAPKPVPPPRPAGAGKRGPVKKAYTSTKPTPSKNPNKARPVAIIDGVDYMNWDAVAFDHQVTRGQYLRCVTDLGVGNVTRTALQSYAETMPTPVRAW